MLGLVLAFPLIAQNRRRTKPAPKKMDPEKEMHLDLLLNDLDAGWRTYSSGANLMYKYQPKTVEWTSENTAMVETRVYVGMPMTPSRNEVIENRKQRGLSIRGYEHFDISDVRWELDCDAKQIRFTSWIDYDVHRYKLDSVTEPSQKTAIVPDSVEENLFNIVCRNNYQAPNYRSSKKSFLIY
jgi:hypothetical protein